MAKIINFHDIYDENWFRETLDVIRQSYEIVPFSEIQKFYKGKIKARNLVHITIDDGHKSTYDIIYPELKRLGYNASIFVSPKIILENTNFWYYESSDYDADQLKTCIVEVLDIKKEKLNDFYPRSVLKTLTLKEIWKIIERYRDKYNVGNKPGQYINRAQLLELELSGVFEIGAHTLNHPILANESAQDSRLEIEASVLKLGELLNRKITTFAYPNGAKGLDFGPREIQTLKEIEIDYAFSFEFKDLNRKDHHLAVPRYGLDHGSREFVTKKLKYGSVWEPVKRLIFNNEDKHRRKIMSSLQS